MHYNSYSYDNISNNGGNCNCHMIIAFAKAKCCKEQSVNESLAFCGFRHNWRMPEALYEHSHFLL